MFVSFLRKYFVIVLLFSNINLFIGRQCYCNINKNNKIINDVICKYKDDINETLIINNSSLTSLHKLLVIIDIFIKKSTEKYNIDKLMYLKGLIYIRLYHGKLFDLNKHNYQNIIYAFKIFNSLKKNNLLFKNNRLLNYYLLYTKKIILKKKINIIKYYFRHHNYISVINRSNNIISYINDNNMLKIIKLMIKYSYLHLSIKEIN
ncbi:MAG: outer membrane protein assembly factor BamD [Candidatus Lightella neohaematopini]|nr:outer membrane protein assembly factor BamD [Candidatus Lightella neohaematopini]